MGSKSWTSKLAWATIGGKVSRCELQVLSVIDQSSRALCADEIEDRLRAFDGPNQMQPRARITALLRSGLIKVAGTSKSPSTGRPVRFYTRLNKAEKSARAAAGKINAGTVLKHEKQRPIKTYRDPKNKAQKTFLRM